MDAIVDADPPTVSEQEIREIENTEEPVLQRLDRTISQIERLQNDVRPLVDVLNNALNMVINVTETLYKQGFFGVNEGLQMLLEFLSDGSVLYEFGAMLNLYLRAIVIFLQCVAMAIKLYQRLKESDLGKAIAKFMSEKLSKLVPRYALTA